MKPKLRPLPNIPVEILSSLSPSQKKMLTQLLSAYRTHFNTYYSFCGGIIHQQGMVFAVWETKLYREILKPTLISRNMFRVMVMIWFMEHSPRFKDERMTQKLIIDTINQHAENNRLAPLYCIRKLEKYAWLRVQKYRWGKKIYFVSDKGQQLITTYQMRFQEHFHELFEPLGLL